MTKRIFIRFIKVLVLGILMLMFATGGYYIAQKMAPSQKSEGAYDFSPENTQKYDEETVVPNLPAGVTGTYSAEENLVSDTNDYVVMCNGNLINLYILNKEGDLIFDRILDIDPNSLQPDDQKLLKEGIVLDTKAELLSLIEDYSS